MRAGYGLFYGRTPSIMVGTAHSNNGINVQTITFTGSSDARSIRPSSRRCRPGVDAAEADHLHLRSSDYQNARIAAGERRRRVGS